MTVKARNINITCTVLLNSIKLVYVTLQPAWVTQPTLCDELSLFICVQVYRNVTLKSLR